ncbi:retrovirus-related Pol polyprotein from transposon 17.6 [Trichonephila clavipes]|nr:retrovirus-related Pol polyprotein from transposon 17.6 [Trichonephila clavipes]
MGHVDCLSRYPVMTITYDEVTTKLANCQRNDEYINSLKTLLENKQINDFVVKNDVLYKIENDNDVLVVPQQMQTEIVKNIHSKGHLGINKTESMTNLSSKRLHLAILTVSYQYEIGDIVAIQRTQFGTGLKLRPKFFGPYEVIKVKPKDRYDVRKIGLHEGPNTTSTAADHMKIFSSGLHGSTAADSVRSEWPLWHAAKSNAVFARRRIELKLKQKLLDWSRELEREKEERERCASRRYLLNIIVKLICKNLSTF